MPRLSVIPEAPSFGSQLAQALGTGLGKGIEVGITQGIQNNINKFNKIQKNRARIESDFSSYSSRFGFDKSLDNESRRDLLKKAENLVDQGYDNLQAITSVYDDYITNLERDAASKEPEKAEFSLLKSALGPFAATKEIGEFLKARETPEGPTRLRSLIGAPLKGAIQGARTVNPLSPENLAHLITGTPQQLPAAVEQVFPTQKKAPERILQTAGKVAPLAAIGGGNPLLILSEIGGAAAAREVANQLGAGEFVQDLAEMTGFALPGLSKLAFSKIGQVLKGKDLRPPSIKELEFKPKPGAPDPKGPSVTGPQVAEEMMETYSNIVNEAVQNLEKKGITLFQINSGDPKAIAELQKEANKAIKLYQEAEKLNLKAFEKQKADIAKKLPESPLEKYYSPEKPSVKKPETLAKESERTKPLKTHIKQNERRARDLQYQILSADQELRSGKLSPTEVERVQATRQANILAHQKALNEIKNANFEIKYGRPPATSEQIQFQIDMTFNELREGIKNPTAKKVEDFKKGFERDKHLIDTADKLVARGELPGPKVFDEYIKIHEQYLKNYKELSKELAEFIKENKSKPRFKAKVKRAEELKDLIDKQQKLTESKLAIQQDKRKAQGILEKPSGAFYKQMLKNLRKDIDEFQKDYFTWNKIASGTEAKTESIAKKTIKGHPEVEKKEFKRTTQEPKTPPKVQKKHARIEIKEGVEAGEKAAKNPTDENIKTAAERSGMSKEEYKDYMDKISEKLKEGVKKVKLGESSLKEELSILKDILSKYKVMPRIARATVLGALFGGLQGLMEEYLGYKPPIAAIGLVAGAFTPGGGFTRLGSGVIANIVHKSIRDGFSKAAANELKSRRGNPKEFDAYYKKLRDKYGDTRANKIRKQAIQS